MAGVNKIILIGNLGRDPEMRYTPAGVAVTNFSLAVSRKYSTSDGESKEDTQWFRVVAWRGLAENCNKYLQKGRQAYVEGRISLDEWEGKDGQNRATLEVVANQVVFIGGGGGERAAEADRVADKHETISEEDLPF